MERIILALDASKPNLNTIEFACYIANLTHSKLTAIFIMNIIGEEKAALKALYALPYVETITSADFPENKEKVNTCQENQRIFMTACSNNGVNFEIRFEKHALAMDISEESRFADLVILDPDTSFENKPESSPSKFVREILEQAECPVIIAPYSFEGINEIFLAYDGSKSSTVAIKHFAHIFPKLSNKTVTVLQVSEKPYPPTENSKLNDLLAAHFTQVNYKLFRGKAADELFGHLLDKTNAFVVMGAYGRGLLSNLLKPSTSNLVVKTVNLAVFIAHS